MKEGIGVKEGNFLCMLSVLESKEMWILDLVRT